MVSAWRRTFSTSSATSILPYSQALALSSWYKSGQADEMWAPLPFRAGGESATLPGSLHSAPAGRGRLRGQRDHAAGVPVDLRPPRRETVFVSLAGLEPACHLGPVTLCETALEGLSLPHDDILPFGLLRPVPLALQPAAARGRPELGQQGAVGACLGNRSGEPWSAAPVGKARRLGGPDRYSGGMNHGPVTAPSADGP